MPIEFVANAATSINIKTALTHTNQSKFKRLGFFLGLFCFVLCTKQAASQLRRPINKFEVYIGVGVTYFSGDISGAEKISQTLGGTFGGGIRYFMSNRWALRAGVSFGRLSAADSLSGSTFHKYRNLDFKSNILDFNVLAEFSIINWDAHSATRRKAYLTKRHNLYIFGGISIFHFHPYGQLYGEWYSLPELTTAGQGLPGGPTPYKLSSFSIPIGMGYKYLIMDGFSIGAEIIFRKTFTDNIDDVSAPYYDNLKLRQLKGDLSADIADKNHFPGGAKRANGAGRGNPNSTDNFAYLTITLNKQLGKGWTRTKQLCQIFN